MKVIRLSVSFIFLATVIVAVSALARTTAMSDARLTADKPQSNRTVTPPANFSAAKTQRSLAPTAEASAIPVDVAYAAHSDGNGGGASGGGLGGEAHRYAPGPAETLVFGIVLLIGGGFLRRRRRTNED